ncbi:hypothetical protein H8959_011143, partial [Pygathrix nigripes]
TCREEHKKKNLEVPVNFAEFSKKYSEGWKTMYRKEKSKFDEMAKVDKVHYDREKKYYGPAKGGKKKKDPNAPKMPPSGFFLFCSEFCSKIISTNPGISIGDVAKKRLSPDSPTLPPPEFGADLSSDRNPFRTPLRPWPAPSALLSAARAGSRPTSVKLKAGSCGAAPPPKRFLLGPPRGGHCGPGAPRHTAGSRG